MHARNFAHAAVFAGATETLPRPDKGVTPVIYRPKAIQSTRSVLADAVNEPSASTAHA